MVVINLWDGIEVYAAVMTRLDSRWEATPGGR